MKTKIKHHVRHHTLKEFRNEHSYAVTFKNLTEAEAIETRALLSNTKGYNGIISRPGFDRLALRYTD